MLDEDNFFPNEAEEGEEGQEEIIEEVEAPKPASKRPREDDEIEEEEEEKEVELVEISSKSKKRATGLPPEIPLSGLLIEAINKGDISRLKKLLDETSNSSAVNGKICGNPPLMYAAFYGRLDMCRLLLDRGAEIDMMNASGATALMWAVKEHRIPVVKFLVEHQANVNVMDKKGFSPLHYAVKLPNPKEALEVVKLLAEAGADVNQASFSSSEGTSDNMGSTVLHEAAAQGNTDLLRVLMDFGADFNKEDSKRRTALHKATSRNHVQAVKELLECGADPNIQDCSGRTPLMWACFFGYVQCVSLLLERGADTSLEDLSKETALHIAQRRQNSYHRSTQPSPWTQILSSLASHHNLMQ